MTTETTITVVPFIPVYDTLKEYPAGELNAIVAGGVRVTDIAKHYEVTPSNVYYYLGKSVGKVRQPSIASLEARIAKRQATKEARALKLASKGDTSDTARAEKAAARILQAEATAARRAELLAELATI